jgi:hypothetical protein
MQDFGEVVKNQDADKVLKSIWEDPSSVSAAAIARVEAAKEEGAAEEVVAALWEVALRLQNLAYAVDNAKGVIAEANNSLGETQEPYEETYIG